MVAIGKMPVVVDLLIYAGDDFRHTLVFTDPLTGLPVDVSGWLYVAQIRNAATDTGSPLASMTFDLSMANVGLVGMLLVPTQTTALLLPAENKSTKTLTWDLQMTDALDATKVRTPFAGSVTVTLDRTR